MTLRLESSGERLDAALARLVPELSRSQAQRLLAQGLVTANGRPLKKNEKSTAGMVLELTLPEARRRTCRRRRFRLISAMKTAM